MKTGGKWDKKSFGSLVMGKKNKCQEHFTTGNLIFTQNFR